MWSPDGVGWVKPAAYHTHHGGSAKGYPVANGRGDLRDFLSFWGHGKPSTKGGCCSTTPFEARSDGGQWGLSFTVKIGLQRPEHGCGCGGCCAKGAGCSCSPSCVATSNALQYGYCKAGEDQPATSIRDDGNPYGCRPGYYMKDSVCWPCENGLVQLSPFFTGSSCTKVSGDHLEFVCSTSTITSTNTSTSTTTATTTSTTAVDIKVVGAASSDTVEDLGGKKNTAKSGDAVSGGSDDADSGNGETESVDEPPPSTTSSTGVLIAGILVPLLLVALVVGGMLCTRRQKDQGRHLALPNVAGGGREVRRDGARVENPVYNQAYVHGDGGGGSGSGGGDGVIPVNDADGYVVDDSVPDGDGGGNPIIYATYDDTSAGAGSSAPAGAEYAVAVTRNEGYTYGPPIPAPTLQGASANAAAAAANTANASAAGLDTDRSTYNSSSYAGLDADRSTYDSSA